MKKVKTLLSVILIVVFLVSLVNIPALAAEGVIVGDTNIYLARDGAVKLPYILTTDGTTPVDGAVYSVSVNGVESEDTAKYAAFDSEGYLYVGQMAKGKTLTVTAQSADCSASLSVNVCNTIYAEDFEDETVGQAVTSSIFDTKTATVITEGDMHVPSDANANKIAKSYTNTSSWTDSQTQLIINGNFEASKLTVEAKVGVHNQADIDGNFPNMNHPVRLTYESGAVYTKFEGTDGVNYILRKRNGDSWLAGIYTTGYSYYKLMPTKMVITNNKTLDIYVDSKSMTYDISSVKGTDAVLQNIAFGSFVDDIEIYSGEKAVSPYVISGQDIIYRAPANTTAKLTYDLAPVIECASVGGAVSLSLKEAYTGVNVSGNEVKVVGSANHGTFTLQAKDSSGNVLGEKDITIVEKVYDWADDYSRAYLDFENQSIGSAPNAKIDSNNRIDNTPEIDTNDSNEIVPVVKSDASHGKFVSAIGYKHWNNNTGSNFYIIPRTGNSTAYMFDSTVTSATLEADFKLDLETMKSSDIPYSLFAVGRASNSGLDLRYTEFADGTMGIYSFMDKDGKGIDSVSGGTLVATVPADTWFNLRVEADFAAKTYELYVDNRLVVSGAKHTMSYVDNTYIGADVDNIALYHGSKDVAIIDNGSVFAGTDIGIKSEYRVAEAESKTVTFNLSEQIGNITADTSLIVAHYSGGTLAGVSYAPVRVTGGKALGCVAVTGTFAAGDYVKAFIWNMDTLVPIK